MKHVQAAPVLQSCTLPPTRHEISGRRGSRSYITPPRIGPVCQMRILCKERDRDVGRRHVSVCIFPLSGPRACRVVSCTRKLPQGGGRGVDGGDEVVLLLPRALELEQVAVHERDDGALGVWVGRRLGALDRLSPSIASAALWTAVKSTRPRPPTQKQTPHRTHHHEGEADAEEDEAQDLVDPREGARPGEAEEEGGGPQGEEAEAHEQEAGGDGLVLLWSMLGFGGFMSGCMV